VTKLKAAQWDVAWALQSAPKTKGGCQSASRVVSSATLQSHPSRARCKRQAAPIASVNVHKHQLLTALSASSE